MSRVSALLELFNAAARGGRVEVDSAVILELMTVSAAIAPVLLVALAWFLASSIRHARRRGVPVEPDRASMQDAALKLRSQLDEMVRKTNDRNNYINSIFSSIEDGFILVDSANRVMLYNPKAMELLALGPEVFFDHLSDAVARSAPVASVLAACRRVTAGKSLEFLTLETEGARLLDVRVGPIVDKYEGKTNFGSLAIVRDVTELRRLESLRKEFVANVSHEFRTPLTLISGFVEMFKMGGSIPAADRKRAFEIMEIETERLKRLVSELLKLSEIEHELPYQAADTIPVARVLDELAASMGRLAEKKGQKLTIRACPADLAVCGNENFLSLAIRNLVDNAIKYTQEGGSISVTADRSGGSVVIAVADTGIGIPRDEQDRIFERFYRIEKSRGSGSGGSGLGLALVKDIASLSGGSVAVSSEVGRGAVFTLSLPAERCDQERANGAAYGSE